MSKLTVTYKIEAKTRKPEKKPDTPPPSEKPDTRPVSRAARMLALAHYVERLVEERAVKSYADAARQLGVSRARMSELMNLVNLPPRVQEGLLLGDLDLSERRVRAVAAVAAWERQQTRELCHSTLPKISEIPRQFLGSRGPYWGEMETEMKAEQSTRELVLAAQRQDEDAFDIIAGRYRGRLLHQIEARMGPEVRSRMAAEDVLQETLVRAFKVIQRFRWQGEESFYRWLGTIAEHIIRKAANRKTLGYLQIENDVVAGGASPATEHRRQERYERLEEALRSLSPEHREVIRLARLEGLRVKDIAVRMRRSEDAVHKLLARALLKLRDSFGDTESLGLPRDQFMDEDDVSGRPTGDEHDEEHR